MPFWMSIEVLDGAFAASQWAESWGDRLAETAVVHGAVDWSWHRQGWGVVFEVAFSDELAWARFRESDAMRAALDAVPDPTAVIVYRGRGGSAGTKVPRRPRPLTGSGAAALPMPFEVLDDLEVLYAGASADRRRLTLVR